MDGHFSFNEMFDQTESPSPPSGQTGSPAVSAVPVGDQSQMIVGDAYEGASRHDKEVALWQPHMGSADSALLPGKEMADARMHDALRNDSYVAGGRALHQDNIVGSIFLLNAKPETKVLWGREDEVWETEYQEEVETKFTLSAESPDCWLDATRMNSLTAQVRLVVGVYVAAGEVLAVSEWLRDASRPFKTAAHLIETERLSDPMDSFLSWDSRRRLRGGVEKDAMGVPLRYHIRQSAIDDWSNPNHNKWKAVPARKPWGRQTVFHAFEQTRVEQSRGVSAMVAALKEMRMTKDFRSMVLQNAIVNATYAASIESDLPSEAAFAAIGANSESPITKVLSDYLSAIESYSSGAKHLKMGGVKIPHLLPGSHLKLRPAGQGGPLGTEFEASLLRYIAATLGVSYEELSRDYTHTNYSSARAAMLQTWKYMQSRKKMVADRYATWLYRLWLEEMINNNRLETLKRSNVPSFYEGLNKDAYSACEWIGAGRGQIDELKETEAAIKRINANLSTEEQEIARLHGGDWRKVKRQRLREQALDRKIGLQRTDDANRQSAATQQTQEVEG